jgi:hypothetical protein
VIPRDWTKAENVETAARLLGTALGKHPLLVLRALRQMVMYQGCRSQYVWASPTCVALLVHIGPAQYAAEKERRRIELADRARLGVKAYEPAYVPPNYQKLAVAEIRKLPPFVLPTGASK